jgi:cyanophycin synthetase
VLESIADESWIVLYDGGQRLPVLPVSGIPATFNGVAVVNVSNSMHAIAASYFAGIDLGLIKSALSVFKAGQELTPGRFNVFDDLPFRIIMDFAHNPDGVQKICEFADRQSVKGRKVIAFAGLSKRSDDLNKKIAQAVAGHFDFYFCKDYEPSEPPKRRFTGPFMQKILIEAGVPESATTVVTFGRDVIFRIFDSCEPGDMLLLLAGHSETPKIPGYIREYRESIAAGRRSSAASSARKL